jgi:hypothetical protein
MSPLRFSPFRLRAVVEMPWGAIVGLERMSRAESTQITSRLPRVPNQAVQRF